MSKIKDGGAAFPTLDSGLAGLQLREHGMTLRDYFAAKAMQAFFSRTDYHGTTEQYAIEAYKAADAMLAERERGE